jgi:hypothetical protein
MPEAEDSHLITPQFTFVLRKVAISAGWRRAILCVLAMGVIAMAVTSTPSARAAGSTVTQCDGVDNQGGRAVHCTVEVDIATDTVTVTTCTGFANAVETCIGPTVSTQSLTAIDQCNGSGNGGGATVKCDVIITGTSPGTASVTISQCIGSGQGGGTQPTTVCIPSSTPNNTSATIQQCDSSGNGGGGTERVKCSVTPASTTASVPTIKQCNGSANGGGALATCTVTISNASAAGTPTAAATTTATTGSVTPTAGGTTTAIPGSGSVTPTAGGMTTATAPSATPHAGLIVVPNTGSGTANGGGGGVWLLVLALGALGVSAIAGATAIRRRYALTRASNRVGAIGDDSRDA